jgi:CDP-6-deoxy-D-xylo-4-hexulose-3-dehydrase
MNWPLNINNFTFLDRLKICQFILNPKNRWTQDVQVKKIEKAMANFVNSKYAVFVSNGSTANTILSQYIKDTINKNIVVFPSTTWQTSCSPWIREGFMPHFIDISLDDFSINKKELLKFVEKNHKKIACIFPTSLIGFCPDIDFYLELENKYNIKVMFDNCENTLGDFKNKNISSYFTSTTSSYFGHQIQSIEGGFIFTNSLKEYEYFLMQRNHGMTRSLKSYELDDTNYINKNVDKLFDFYNLGNNFRNTDLNAFIGLLDINRINIYKEKRISLYNLYKSLLDKNKFYLPSERQHCQDVAFCLPIIVKNQNKSLYEKAFNLCKQKGIEYRPIISGFLGYQTCYKKFIKNHNKYKNSIYLHNYGFYVGLYSDLKEKRIIDFVKELNKL